MVLTVRAVAMTAGVRDQLPMRTFRALDLHLGAGLCAALFYGRECPSVLRPESVPILRQEVRLEGVDEGSQADHLTCLQTMVKPSIRPLIRSMA
jgi:hypothetical protein